jgi:hypothetical protein
LLEAALVFLIARAPAPRQGFPVNPEPKVLHTAFAPICKQKFNAAKQQGIVHDPRAMTCGISNR